MVVKASRDLVLGTSRQHVGHLCLVATAEGAETHIPSALIGGASPIRLKHCALSRGSHDEERAEASRLRRCQWTADCPGDGLQESISGRPSIYIASSARMVSKAPFFSPG